MPNPPQPSHLSARQLLIIIVFVASTMPFGSFVSTSTKVFVHGLRQTIPLRPLRSLRPMGSMRHLSSTSSTSSMAAFHTASRSRANLCYIARGLRIQPATTNGRCCFSPNESHRSIPGPHPSSSSSTLFSTTTAKDDSINQGPSKDEEEYDWDAILPFEKNSYNSLKITVPELSPNHDRSDPKIPNDPSDPFHPTTFQTKLEATLTAARELHKTALWLSVPLSRAHLMECASHCGFQFHHAEGRWATLVLWISEEECRIPTFATHQVGVGAVVIHVDPTTKTKHILCVREKRRNYRPWKIPGGLAELGEDLDAAVVREVLEETGIRCRFLSVLGVRHAHGVQFGRSDLFFVCRLEPIVDESDDNRSSNNNSNIDSGESGKLPHPPNLPTPIPQEGEIEAAAWLPLDDYRSMVDSPRNGLGHPMMSHVMKLVDQEWERNDIQRKILPSVVPGRRASPLYHAPLNELREEEE